MPPAWVPPVKDKQQKKSGEQWSFWDNKNNKQYSRYKYKTKIISNIKYIIKVIYDIIKSILIK